MKKLDEILNKKRIELENIENEFVKKAEDFKQKKLKEELLRKDKLKEELLRKESNKLEQDKLAKFSKKNTIKRFALDNAYSYGFKALIIGAVIGFIKGCSRYSNSNITSSGYKPFLEPFRYIIPNALIIGLFGVVIGILVGIKKGQNN